MFIYLLTEFNIQKIKMDRTVRKIDNSKIIIKDFSIL